MRRRYEYGQYRFLQLHYRMLLLHHQSSVCSPISFDHEVTFVVECFSNWISICEDVPMDLHSRNEDSYHK